MRHKNGQNHRDLSYLGELAVTHMQSQRKLHELRSIYVKDECSTEDAARLVGLKLPLTKKF